MALPDATARAVGEVGVPDRILVITLLEDRIVRHQILDRRPREVVGVELLREVIEFEGGSRRSSEQALNQKTVAKWKRRTAVKDLPTGPKDAYSTVLSIEEEAIIVAFCRHTLLPLDDCLYALQPTIPNLTRSSLHRCLQRHGISRLPEVTGDKEPKRKFKTYPIGYFHIDIAEVQTAEGKLRLFVAIDRTSKFAPSTGSGQALSNCTRKPARWSPPSSCAI